VADSGLAIPTPRLGAVCPKATNQALALIWFGCETKKLLEYNIKIETFYN